MLLGKMDEFGKIGWITLVVLGFWFAWPVGLILLGFMFGSKRLHLPAFAGGGCNMGSWFAHDAQDQAGGAWTRRPRQQASSGNNAFDAYKDETLRRLEEEEREFKEFLDRLRKARDKSEFDAFMAERRGRQMPTETTNI